MEPFDQATTVISAWMVYGSIILIPLILVLQVGDQTFRAHRIVLAASIPYFHAMFTNDMVESKQEEITISGVDPV